ncbi:guanine nucleotide-binding protein G(I)/G(S)/G(O) subunit gamma-8 [Lates japonicus]|uniref:Guanine nucleotide-binding protein G(I)/G(S)/G(O) subunit gamma-8 n=1 Tax=Lates japonicus TaxID=270547 RepID=A0AAD3M3E0_LATJO|nr:guanine nucleotide-binding protein G(I)/G(S)/G(O) subunit gamma-8 [Lates japonicus]
MAKIADARKTVEQLKLEVNIERMMVRGAGNRCAQFTQTSQTSHSGSCQDSHISLDLLGIWELNKASQWPTLADMPFLALFSSFMAFG